VKCGFLCFFILEIYTPSGPASNLPALNAEELRKRQLEHFGSPLGPESHSAASTSSQPPSTAQRTRTIDGMRFDKIRMDIYNINKSCTKIAFYLQICWVFQQCFIFVGNMTRQVKGILKGNRYKIRISDCALRKLGKERI